MSYRMRSNGAQTPSKQRRLHLLFLPILVILFCPPLVSKGHDLSSKETASAQKLYTAKCAKCHQFYDPKAYNQSDWDMWMGKMKKKSKLKEEQFQLLSRYLDNVRAEKSPSEAKKK